ncbi:MAG: LytR C-terminal domain-containing protein [Elusimicrobia bacterium]|nr:LytR C-terminal domain-containing protein [Elusimicrobiota bacterium]
MLNKIFNYFVLLLGIALMASAIHMYRTDPLSQKISTGKPLNFKVLLYTDYTADVLYITYDTKNNLIRVLSFNPEITVLERVGRSRNLNFAFFGRPELSLEEKTYAMFAKVRRLSGGVLQNYYTFVINLNDFSHVPVIETYINTEYRNMRLAAQIRLIEFLGKSARNSFIDFTRAVFENYELLNTDMPKLSMFNLIMHVSKYEPLRDIIFIEYPWHNNRRRIEPLNESSVISAKKMFANINLSPLASGRPPVINVINASGIRRLAEMTSWRLRQNNFDIFEWSSTRSRYDTTIIKNYRANFACALEIKNILGAGVIINFPNTATRRDIEIFMGKDSKIYDELDRISRN